jgi:hypothetical protein
MLALYRQTLALAFRRALRAWPVAFSVLVYAAILYGAALLLMPLGIVGGFLIGFVAAACVSSYLHLLSQAVSGSRVSFADMKQGFAARLWDVVSVLFAFWILSFLVGFVVRAAGPNGPAVAAMVGLAMAFFFNPVPELLYLGQSRSFALLGDAARFVLANPVAWFLPNLVLAAILLAPTGELAVSHPGELLLVFQRIFSQGGVFLLFGQTPLWALPALLLLLHFAMVFRGLLYQELSSGNPRMRAFRARAAGE